MLVGLIVDEWVCEWVVVDVVVLVGFVIWIVWIVLFVVS